MRALRSLPTLVAFACMAMAADTEQQMYDAIRANDLPSLAKLLDQGASAKTLDERGTPLMYAAQVGSLEAMKLLLDRGAEIDAANSFGSTALMWSAADQRKARLLLDRGANVNLVARNGRTALTIAAFTNPSTEIVRLLLARGAKVNVADQRNVTPLFGAAFGGDTESVRLLLEAGADPDVGDSFTGLTPLKNAAGMRNAAAVKLLLAKGAKVNDDSKREGLPKIRIGTVAFGGFTALAMSAPYGPPEVVKALLDAGADPNIADVRGYTPLMLAAATDRQDPVILKMLLAHGAKPEMRNLDRESATDWAWKIGKKDGLQALDAGRKPDTFRAVAEPAADLRTAVAKSLALLERTNAQFFRATGCFACHEQTPATMVASAAAAKGIPVEETVARDRIRQVTQTLGALASSMMDGPKALGGADDTLYSSEALIRANYAPDRTTDAMAANIAMLQHADGGWHLPGYSRSPIQDSDFSRTTYAIRALQKYGTPGRKEELSKRLESAKQWLLKSDAAITEDLDMRLVGVAAVGADAALRRKLAEPILSKQRKDGGWAQRDEFQSDAYATGMTLWALLEAGIVKTNDPIYRRGVEFLRSTQAADGSWYVASRATKFQPYIESGFPYGHDQWVSTMGTGWAASALAAAIE